MKYSLNFVKIGYILRIRYGNQKVSRQEIR